MRVFVVLLVLIAGCIEKGDYLSYLEIRVKDLDDNPIENAYLSGGVDWDRFSGYTDKTGCASFWIKPRKYKVFAQKTNFFTDWNYISLDPFEKNYLELILEPTTGEVKIINSIPSEGLIIKMVPYETNLLAIQYEGKMQLWNCNDPANPFIEREYNLTSPIKDFVIENSFLYYTSGDAGVIIVDISKDPIILDSIETNGIATGITILDTLLFVGNSLPPGGVRIYNIKNPSYPLFLAEIPHIMANSMLINFPYLFITGEGCGPCVIDISDPQNPFIFMRQEAFGWDIKIWKEKIYVALPDRIEVYSLDNLGSPPVIFTTGGIEKILVAGEDSLLLGGFRSEEKPSLSWVLLKDNVEIVGTYFKGDRVWPLIRIDDWYYLLRGEEFLDAVKFKWERK